MYITTYLLMGARNGLLRESKGSHCEERQRRACALKRFGAQARQSQRLLRFALNTMRCGASLAMTDLSQCKL
jgi:hypothetical protein